MKTAGGTHLESSHSAAYRHPIEDSSVDTQSAEYRAIRRSYSTVKKGIDPNNLREILYSNFLLTPEEKESTMQKGLSDMDILERLHKCLERRISITPNSFHTLVQALKKEPALEKVADQIESK